MRWCPLPVPGRVDSMVVVVILTAHQPLQLGAVLLTEHVDLV